MALTLQPGCRLHTSCNRGLLQAFQRSSLSQTARRPQNLAVQGTLKICLPQPYASVRAHGNNHGLVRVTDAQ